MDRLEKNKQIAQTMRQTYDKRKSQICHVYKMKVDKSSLSRQQANALKMMFVESKWIYNWLLDKDVWHIDYKELSNITHKDKDGNDIEVSISYASTAMRQSVIKQVCNQIKGLSRLKANGHQVGNLRHKSEWNSIELKQYGNTHTIKGKNKIKIQGIKQPLRVRGIDQLPSQCDYANAKLLYDGIDYWIALTCYIDKTNDNKTYDNDILGIDMGVKDTLTLSNGQKIDVSVEESDHLKRLQAKLARQKKGSNNRYKTRLKIRKEWRHIANKKNDIANKIVARLLQESKVIVLQDEQISQWKQDGMSGKKIQHSILGRVKAKLLQHDDRIVLLDKWCPTTRWCPTCGHKIKIGLNERTFVCNDCHMTEDRDIHAAKNMVWMYATYTKLDRSGTDQTSKKPGTNKIAWNKLQSKLAKQEDTTSLALC